MKTKIPEPVVLFTVEDYVSDLKYILRRNDKVQAQVDTLVRQRATTELFWFLYGALMHSHTDHRSEWKYLDETALRQACTDAVNALITPL